MKKNTPPPRTAIKAPRTVAPALNTLRTGGLCNAWAAAWFTPTLSSPKGAPVTPKLEDKTYLDNVDARIQTFTYNLDRITPYLPRTGRMLEVGSYCGIFLGIAKDRGYDVTGVEPSVWASSYSRQTHGISTITGVVSDLPKETPAFDVVCSWDVLEHVSDPLGELKRINQRLRTGGIFAFSTLNYGNWLPRLLGERWPWMMDMHLYYFDQKITKQMLQRAGFKLVHARNYCHIITLEYFMLKLAALGIPAAAGRGWSQRRRWRGLIFLFTSGISSFTSVKKSRMSKSAPLRPEKSAGDTRQVSIACPITKLARPQGQSFE